jgi:hypothetical protein
MKTNRILLSIAAVALSAAISPNTSQAEIAVWPGNVIAPFVHVQWNGRYVHVCAPFVNLTVDMPRCRCCDQVIQQPCEATSNWQTTRRTYAAPTRHQLAKSAGALSQALEQFETAESWQNYLAVAPGDDLVTTQTATPLDATSQRDNLINVLRHFDSANRDPQYSQITRLPEFRETHMLLANYLARQPQLATDTNEATAASFPSESNLAVSYLARAIDTARTLPAAAPSTENAKSVRQTAVEELPPPKQHSGI